MPISEINPAKIVVPQVAVFRMTLATLYSITRNTACLGGLTVASLMAPLRSSLIEMQDFRRGALVLVESDRVTSIDSENQIFYLDQVHVLHVLRYNAPRSPYVLKLAPSVVLTTQENVKVTFQVPTFLIKTSAAGCEVRYAALEHFLGCNAMGAPGEVVSGSMVVSLAEAKLQQIYRLLQLGIILSGTAASAVALHQSKGLQGLPSTKILYASLNKECARVGLIPKGKGETMRIEIELGTRSVDDPSFRECGFKVDAPFIPCNPEDAPCCHCSATQQTNASHDPVSCEAAHAQKLTSAVRSGPLALGGCDQTKEVCLVDELPGAGWKLRVLPVQVESMTPAKTEVDDSWLDEAPIATALAMAASSTASCGKSKSMRRRQRHEAQVNVDKTDPVLPALDPRVAISTGRRPRSHSATFAHEVPTSFSNVNTGATTESFLAEIGSRVMTKEFAMSGHRLHDINTAKLAVEGSVIDEDTRPFTLVGRRSKSTVHKIAVARQAQIVPAQPTAPQVARASITVPEKMSAPITNTKTSQVEMHIPIVIAAPPVMEGPSRPQALQMQALGLGISIQYKTPQVEIPIPIVIVAPPAMDRAVSSTTVVQEKMSETSTTTKQAELGAWAKRLIPIMIAASPAMERPSRPQALGLGISTRGSEKIILSPAKKYADISGKKNNDHTRSHQPHHPVNPPAILSIKMLECFKFSDGSINVTIEPSVYETHKFESFMRHAVYSLQLCQDQQCTGCSDVLQNQHNLYRSRSYSLCHLMPLACWCKECTRQHLYLTLALSIDDFYGRGCVVNIGNVQEYFAAWRT